MAATAALTAVTAVALVWLAAGLPAGAFFSGDSGVKLIAAREAIAHPGRPFEIDLPRIGERSTPFVDPMVIVHGSHAHALQSPLFPPLSAPLIAAFGERGAYLLPALAFVVLVPLLVLIAARTVPETSRWLLAWLTIAANPLLFYALEYWEHAPAVALLAAGTAAVTVAASRDDGNWLAAAGGALTAAGVLLRPEGAWYAAGLLATLARPRWLPFAAGTACVGLPFAAANLVHFGNPLGAHAAAVLAPIGEGFAAARWTRVQDWLWPSSALEWAGVLLTIAAWPLAAVVKDLRSRQLLALAGTAIVAVLAARRQIPEASFWQGFPLAMLALVPTTPTRPARQLAVLALVAMSGVVLTATNDGGAQWGVRYLLIAAPPLLLLGARAATDASGAGRWQALRVAVLVVICFAGAMTSRAAYVELRGTKRNYDGLVAAVRAFTPQDGVVVTNAWWLDQLAATLHRRRVFLFVPDEAAAQRAFAALSAEGVERVTLAWSEDGTAPFALDRALAGTCVRVGPPHDAPLRALRLAGARCTASEPR